MSKVIAAAVFVGPRDRRLKIVAWAALVLAIIPLAVSIALLVVWITHGSPA